MNTYGYLGVCFLIAVENLFPPIPSEVILTFGGFMTTYTRLTVPGVVIFSTLGSTIGALILYRGWMALTPETLENVTKGKLFHVLGFEKEDVEETIGWFEKHGKKAILLGRCIPIIRSLVSVPAGMAEIEIPLFLVYTVIGSTLWNILLVCLGAALGASWETVLVYLDRYSSVIRVLLIAGAALWLIRSIRKKWNRKKEAC
ncbi:DedA family protein [Schaedlerella sp.]|uniref:DedA family protein n=1 Tax=Schaedlerella sp. TaxID=2676057 RepID=UPI003528175B